VQSRCCRWLAYICMILHVYDMHVDMHMYDMNVDMYTCDMHVEMHHCDLHVDMHMYHSTYV